jgi:Ca2+/Na+ antiporter
VDKLALDIASRRLSFIIYQLCTCDTYVKFIKSICELALKSIGEKGFMVSFEFSVIDIVLMIAIVVLLALYLTKSSTERRAELERSINEEKTLEKPTVSVKTKKSSEESVPTTSVETENSVKCTHYFGYLKTLSKDAPIPDECFTCPKYIRCAFEGK